MKVGQVLYRLQRWKKRPENVDVLYINFDMIKKAMIGDARIKRIVDDPEVGSTMALCYEDSEARSGYRFLLSTEEKDIAEKMERSNEPREQKKGLPSVKHGEIVKMMWKSMKKDICRHRMRSVLSSPCADLSKNTSVRDTSVQKHR